ncbi:MAG: class I SAM-dependent methyltransferase [Anaerolineaceae bacterium]|jgi:SAM-dependent methyltransferase
MKLLALLYARLDRSHTAKRFNRFYWLDKDPFGAKDSKYELSKQDRLLEFIAQQENRLSLDVGCGNGFLSRRIAAHCGQLIGIDFSSKAIQLAQQNCAGVTNISLHVDDIRNYEHAEVFNLIICSEVLYYLHGQALDDVVKKLHRLSAPDGRLALVGRADASIVPHSLQRWFTLADQAADRDWYRPYAVSIYQPQPAIHPESNHTR